MAERDEAKMAQVTKITVVSTIVFSFVASSSKLCWLFDHCTLDKEMQQICAKNSQMTRI